MPEVIRILPRIRERLEELRERIRRPRAERGVERGEIEVGAGRLIEVGKKRVTKVVERAKELRPGVIPKVAEIVAEWYPGKRLMRVITPKTEIVKPGEITYKEAEEEYPIKKERGVHY